MRKVTGFFVILALAAAVLSCDADLSGKTEQGGKSVRRAVQGQEIGLRGHRHDGRFKNFTQEEWKLHFQKVRENGGKTRPNFEGEHPFIERLRLENPGKSDEELKALAKERFAAHKEIRQKRSGEARHEEFAGKRPHGKRSVHGGRS